MSTRYFFKWTGLPFSDSFPLLFRTSDLSFLHATKLCVSETWSLIFIQLSFLSLISAFNSNITVSVFHSLPQLLWPSRHYFALTHCNNHIAEYMFSCSVRPVLYSFGLIFNVVENIFQNPYTWYLLFYFDRMESTVKSEII